MRAVGGVPSAGRGLTSCGYGKLGPTKGAAERKHEKVDASHSWLFRNLRAALGVLRGWFFIELLGAFLDPLSFVSHLKYLPTIYFNTRRETGRPSDHRGLHLQAGSRGREGVQELLPEVPVRARAGLRQPAHAVAPLHPRAVRAGDSAPPILLPS